jgi:hypothetical protein
LKQPEAHSDLPGQLSGQIGLRVATALSRVNSRRELRPCPTPSARYRASPCAFPFARIGRPASRRCGQEAS